MTPWRALITSAMLLAAFFPLHAQDAVVSRNVNLRLDPSSENPAIRLLLSGEELFILSDARVNNYYSVRTIDGVEGWAYAPRVDLLDDPTPTPGPLEVFGGCGMEGSATRADIQSQNRLKNRTTAPSSEDIDSSIVLQAILQPGDDRDRFEESDGAVVTGFVHAVKAGGAETVNCGANTVDLKDAHIEITLSESDTARDQRFVVEITPKWRAFMADRGIDWSNATLASTLRGRCAEFAGWMFWDGSHPQNAANTNPTGSQIWRATAWEIHPVTSVRAVPCPGDPDAGGTGLEMQILEGYTIERTRALPVTTTVPGGRLFNVDLPMEMWAAYVVRLRNTGRVPTSIDSLAMLFVPDATGRPFAAECADPPAGSSIPLDESTAAVFGADKFMVGHLGGTIPAGTQLDLILSCQGAFIRSLTSGGTAPTHHVLRLVDRRGVIAVDTLPEASTSLDRRGSVLESLADSVIAREPESPRQP
jgi:hypothetical protein